MFSILHDCSHGAFLKSKKAENIIGFVCGIVTLTPFKCWRKIHATHHACSSNLDRRDIGDFLLYTVKEYLELPKKEKLKYKFMRNPFTILCLVPFVLFFILQRMPTTNISNFTQEEKDSVAWTNLALLAVIIVIGSIIGYKNFFLVQFPISMIVSTVGVWMFYIQHQFEDTYWAKKEELNYYLVSMKGSSFYKLPKILQWITGNTGYHHIHHLSPLIPNYKLQKCYDENPIFHDAPTITLQDSFKAFSLALWDEEKQKLVSFKSIEK
jgi:omega-6 fatty acid desaturase (delta-12 desaturase)